MADEKGNKSKESKPMKPSDIYNSTIYPRVEIKDGKYPNKKNKPGN